MTIKRTSPHAETLQGYCDNYNRVHIVSLADLIDHSLHGAWFLAKLDLDGSYSAEFVNLSSSSGLAGTESYHSLNACFPLLKTIQRVPNQRILVKKSH